ncbi:MAG: 2-dehydropantoate 2-reductase [Bacillaceae bacterium]|nr:2-dehydropantoate 2-reductase [Bacillaceae bacterium]
MNIGIVGAGSIGLLISAYLSKHGHEIHCYVQREEQVDHLNKNGVHLLPEGKSFPVKARLADQMQEHELLIVCVKQPQLHHAVSLIKENRVSTMPVLFLQNGMGHLESVKAIQQPVWIGAVDHGALRVNDFTVKHTGEGKILAGSYNLHSDDQIKPMLSQLNHPEFPVIYESDWIKILKRKLVVNAAINPLTALFKIKNGEILTLAPIQKLAKNLCREACDVLALDEQEMWEQVIRVADRTKENKTSMYTDLERGQETEIEAISGYLLTHSMHPLPYTEFVYNGIKALELKTQEEGEK